MFLSNRLFIVSIVCLQVVTLALADEPQTRDFSPSPIERQLPLRMHSQMEQRPVIHVGINSGELIGTDNRVLQAAVDYIAGLGGGTVKIGPGEYLMHDSLHLRSFVTIEGVAGKTILRKAAGTVSVLALDADFGEQQFTVQASDGFKVGRGVAIWDDSAGGFHTTVARITGKTGHTFSVDRPMMSDCLTSRNAKAGTLFPVISGYDLEGVVIRGLTIDGNRSVNAYLNGCRGGGIFLYRAFGTKIENCLVRNYNGDGISFQQSNDVVVDHCISEGHASLGIHPGSGSQRPTVRHCIARNNGTDGLYLCWRVRHGLFEHNVLEDNGQFGISIGHKDSDNLLRKNIVRRNQSNGIFFRNELLGMAAHRNRLIENIIEDNGQQPGTAAIRVRGATNGLIFKGNVIRDTRKGSDQTQTTGFLFEENVGNVLLEDNQIEAKDALIDRRAKQNKTAAE